MLEEPISTEKQIKKLKVKIAKLNTIIKTYKRENELLKKALKTIPLPL